MFNVALFQCYIWVSVSTYQLKSAEKYNPVSSLWATQVRKYVSASGSDSGAPRYVMWGCIRTMPPLPMYPIHPQLGNDLGHIFLQALELLE